MDTKQLLHTKMVLFRYLIKSHAFFFKMLYKTDLVFFKRTFFQEFLMDGKCLF